MKDSWWSCYHSVLHLLPILFDYSSQPSFLEYSPCFNDRFQRIVSEVLPEEPFAPVTLFCIYHIRSQIVSRFD